MGLLDWLFRKRKGPEGTSLFEVPITVVHERLPQNRSHEAFRMLKEKHPNIPDEHVDMLIRFAYAAEKEGLSDIGGFLLASCQQYAKGEFFINKSGGNYCLCMRKG